MEQLLRAELRTATLRAFGSPGAGCISEGRAYDTDAGPVFVKINHRTLVRAPHPSHPTALFPSGLSPPPELEAEGAAGRGGLGEVGEGRSGARGPGAQGKGALWSGPLQPWRLRRGVSLRTCWAVTSRGRRAQAFSAGFQGSICRGVNLLPFAWMPRLFRCLF